jgi:hypothetical protein
MPRQTRAEFMASVAKRYGVVAIAKHVIDVGPLTPVTEHELTKAITDAVECQKGETKERAFARVFSDDTEAGVLLRKAFAVINSNNQVSYLRSEPLHRRPSRSRSRRCRFAPASPAARATSLATPTPSWSS